MNHGTRVRQILVAQVLKVPAVAKVSHALQMKLVPVTAGRWKTNAATMVMTLNAIGILLTFSDSIRRWTTVVFEESETAAASQATIHNVATAPVNQIALLASDQIGRYTQQRQRA